MSIFNSLGSNYTLTFAIKSLFARSSKGEKAKLRRFLEEKYGEKAFLTYKGRDAFRLALRSINKKGSTVAVCGFTCFAVYEAIKMEGYKIAYLDIEKDSLNFSAQKLSEAIKNNPKIKIVIIQNTLGYPCEIEEIAKICKINNLILIEDLAHSIGSIYDNKKEAGTIGDFTILSFSQDKMIDGVSGGALVVRRDKFTIFNIQYSVLNSRQIIKDKLYPIFTYIIRKTYHIGIGKIIHHVLKCLNMLSEPMGRSGEEIKGMPYWYCSAMISGFNNLSKNLIHRRKIAKIYAQYIDNSLLFQKLVEDIDQSSNLRFPIFIERRNGLVNYLRKHQIYLSDIWYDAPIAPKKYIDKTDYINGQCPNSEYISDTIINLPTHKNISEKNAELIAHRINLWIKSQ